jgi:type I restriction enzyme R subunit
LLYKAIKKEGMMNLEELNKKSLSERDICTKFITPALVNAGWDVVLQVREEFTFTDGRIIVRGQMAVRSKQRKRADYVLSYKSGIRLAIIEAKDNNHSVGAGMQQAIGYAEALDVPFVYISNGDAFIERDRTRTGGELEREISLDAFPSPEELWQRYSAWKGIERPEQQAVVTQDYYTDVSGKRPRYFQEIAINRVIEAIVREQNRVLLVMATGTGKTYTAFQIIWRLWKSKTKKRILFLADRNILIDQTKMNDFQPFGGAMTKVINRKVDKSYEIYLALYQAVSGTEEEQNIYKQFSPDFFDLVVVDECHRGSAAEDSSWREILEYFESATQIGMTATPKETTGVSNIEYFREPVYIYSLRQGIADGFLAPYKVVRIDIDRDLEGWWPTPGQRDRYDNVIEDREYNRSDFDRTLILEERTRLVARKVSEFLKATDRYAKTIIFCEDIDHAERMRQALVNENGDLCAENSKYVMKITGDDKEGKAELDNFIMPESRYPVIVTTSRLLSTGVDAQTCKLIVLDRNINSMTEFKQIIGRGTRINEEYGKLFFTIMDFRGATRLFRDPDFDGEPVQIYEPGPDEPPVPPEEPTGEDEEGGQIVDPPPGSRQKFYVSGEAASVASERVQYYGPDGQLITESLKDYTRQTVRASFASLDDFLRQWSDTEQKQAIIAEMGEQGMLFEALAEEVGREFDAFDLICHVAFDQKPLTRRERASRVRKRNYFGKYGEQARRVLEALLDKYADDGVEHIEGLEVLKVRPLDDFGSPVEIVKAFGGKQQYTEAVRELEAELYGAA